MDEGCMACIRSCYEIKSIRNIEEELVGGDDGFGLIIILVGLGKVRIWIFLVVHAFHDHDSANAGGIKWYQLELDMMG